MNLILYMKNIMVRPDFIFSYWIFLWYILYYFKIIQYNPKFALTIGLLENVFTICLMIYFKNSYLNIILFCIINLFIKVIPLWTLRKTNYHIKQLFYTIVLFIIYLLWVYINIQDPYYLIEKSYNNLKQNKPIGPVSEYLSKIFK